MSDIFDHLFVLDQVFPVQKFLDNYQVPSLQSLYDSEIVVEVRFSEDLCALFERRDRLINDTSPSLFPRFFTVDVHFLR